MAERKVWLITGAARGMGVHFAKAALAAGHAVVATGRRPDAVAEALGASNDLLVATLDVTSLSDANTAAMAAVARFGRIDVLVNNAANFQAGYFEELTPAQVERQLSTSLVGPMNVARAVLPVMRRQRSGHIISISSSAGLAGFEFCTAYSAMMSLGCGGSSPARFQSPGGGSIQIVTARPVRSLTASVANVPNAATKLEVGSATSCNRIVP